MKCPASDCADGIVPRPEGDPLARFGGTVCGTCGGAGSIPEPAGIRGLGNVGPGASGKLPDAVPRIGTYAKEAKARCPCKGGTNANACDGACACC